MRMDETQIGRALARIPRWRRTLDTIQRTYEFATFAEAIAFVDSVADAADTANHHPDIDIRYRRVTLASTTHDAGGLTNLDFALAERCDILSESFG